MDLHMEALSDDELVAIADQALASLNARYTDDAEIGPQLTEQITAACDAWDVFADNFREEGSSPARPIYTVEKQYEGVYHVLDDEGERVARVGRFMPGPMVSVAGPQITSPAMARAIAKAMVALANEIDK